ncbi:MAG: aspartyl protease family protein [Bradymonadaceae bacterium]
MRLTLHIAFIAFFSGLLVSACATTPAAEPEETIKVVKETEKVDGWERLRKGDIDGARRAFEALRAHESSAMEGVAGLLRIAQIVRDVELAGSLLDELPEAPAAFLEVTAAQTALSLKLSSTELLMRACEHRNDPRVGSDARAICARAALQARYPEQIVCREGCGESHQWPLTMVGSAPVLMASVAGAPPAPFIVDTGASSNVISRTYAKELGLEPVPGTGFDVSSSGGGVPTALTIADIRLGDLQKANTPFILLDLPLEGIAGVLSPQALFSDFVVVADFGDNMTLSLHPPSTSFEDPSLARFDLLLDQGVLQLIASLGERPAGPLLLDTGADRTRLTAALDDMGTDLERGRETQALSAGGTVRTWQTRGSLLARAGVVGDEQAIEWSVRDPLVYEPSEPPSAARMHWQGMLGMDFLMGRKLVLDLPEGALHISTEATLASWPVGSRQTVRIEGSLLESTALVEEIVHAHDGEYITLDVKLTQGEDEERFRIRMRDDWASRGSWLLTRPIESYAVFEEGEVVDKPIEEGLKTWMRVFSPFTVDGRPTVTIEEIDGPDGPRLCSRFEAPARAFDAKPEQAVFNMWECPGPWRVARVQVTDEEGALLWGFETLNQDQP